MSILGFLAAGLMIVVGVFMLVTGVLRQRTGMAIIGIVYPVMGARCLGLWSGCCVALTFPLIGRVAIIGSEEHAMPLRDHFHPPVSKRSSWEGFHGGWPMSIVAELAPRLPDGFVAEPRVHLGAYYEIDVCAFEQGDERGLSPTREPNGGLATATQAISAPTLTVDVDFPEQYSYEVLIFDLQRERRLVAAVEIVSPANKDRPQSRQLFVAKCFNLLRQDVCLSIIDLITIRQFNLYTELLALLERSDPTSTPPTPIYAVTCRKRRVGRQTKLEAWSRPLAIGQPLPSLPVWLSETQTVTLDLEASYEETCRVLRIP